MKHPPQYSYFSSDSDRGSSTISSSGRPTPPSTQERSNRLGFMKSEFEFVAGAMKSLLSKLVQARFRGACQGSRLRDGDLDAYRARLELGVKNMQKHIVTITKTPLTSMSEQHGSEKARRVRTAETREDLKVQLGYLQLGAEDVVEEAALVFNKDDSLMSKTQRKLRDEVKQMKGDCDGILTKNSSH